MTVEIATVKPNPHGEKIRESLEKLKGLSSTTDGWNFVQEKDNVKLYNKPVEGNELPIVRGDVFLEGDYAVKDALSVCTLPGCREIWDDKYGGSEVKEWYGRYETLFWTKIKTPWPVSPRDISGTSLREFTDNEGYIVMTSVEDSAIPEISGNVRANLILSGWKVNKTDKGLHIVYITHIDLAGSIPSYILKSVQQQVPLCAGKVADYVKDYGCPPTFIGGTAKFKEESFDHAKRHYECELVGEGDGKWFVNPKMYPKGFGIQLVQEGTSAEVNGQEVTITGINGYVKVNIVKA